MKVREPPTMMKYAHTLKRTVFPLAFTVLLGVSLTCVHTVHSEKVTAYKTYAQDKQQSLKNGFKAVKQSTYTISRIEKIEDTTYKSLEISERDDWQPLHVPMTLTRIYVTPASTQTTDTENFPLIPVMQDLYFDIRLTDTSNLHVNDTLVIEHENATNIIYIPSFPTYSELHS